MRPTALAISLTMMAAGAAHGQQAPAATAFDVASVRVSQVGKAGGEGSRRESIQFSPDSVTMRNVRFRTAVRWAYDVMDYQVTGPDWITSERYDIAAKSASEVPQGQLRLMLQTLLAERFKLAIHRQTKELPAYVLLVAKGGPKFKESVTEGEPSVQPDQRRLSVTVQRTPISQLVEGLSNILRTPVVDETGLKGKYDVTIDAAKYIPDIAAARGDGGGGVAAPIDPVSIIMTGIQEELGLKLESRKVPLDLVIVDRAEKVPTEN
ncbi:MAG TPA: TIGR03435 family protein [Bryobacteraceae bacterium]